MTRSNPSKAKKAKTPKPAKKTGKKSSKRNPDNREKVGKIEFEFLDTKGLKHLPEILAFIHWYAVPKDMRDPKTHGEVAAKLGVDINTLSEWKKRLGFFDEVAKVNGQFMRRFTPDVYGALAKRARKTGGDREVRLFAELFEGFSKKATVEVKPPATVGNEERKQLRDAFANVGLSALVAVSVDNDDDEDEDPDIEI